MIINSVAGGENTFSGLRQLGEANSLLTPFYSRLRGGVPLLPCLRMARSVQGTLLTPSRARHPYTPNGVLAGAGARINPPLLHPDTTLFHYGEMLNDPPRPNPPQEQTRAYHRPTHEEGNGDRRCFEGFGSHYRQA
jgi:hypothetical protein